MRFESPWAFLLLLIIPLLLVWRRGVPQAALRFSWVAGAAKAQGSWREQLAWIPDFLRYLALILLVVALARPQRGTEQVRDINEGVAIMMVVDHSGSMQAEMDFGGRRMNRLEVVKEVFREFVKGNGRGLAGRPSDLIGMVAFARYADTLCPLTLAHGALEYFLKSLKIVTQKEED
ncbi:MAG: VWA domain-containing protein, partial [Deltaproteobacteria bacterium]|nr:VWA domain-containing protein [Deltaproteobacteria bacterium]